MLDIQQEQNKDSVIKKLKFLEEVELIGNEKIMNCAKWGINTLKKNKAGRVLNNDWERGLFYLG